VSFAARSEANEQATLKLIGVGFGRTGTVSLRSALETIGYGPCYHMKELYDRPERLPRWQQAVDGRRPWRDVLEGYRATLGWPGAAFWRELMDNHPKAKLILTTRDHQSWYESAHSTLYQSRFDADGNRRRPLGPAGDVADFNERVIWDGMFDGRFLDRDHAIRVIQAHESAIRAEVPRERLLVFRATDGWQPLCEFLGHEVPAYAYPSRNTTEQFNSAQRRQGGEVDAGGEGPVAL